MKRIFEGFIILSVVLLFSTTAQAKKVAGIDVPETTLVHKEVLQLNGVGVREKYFLDIYLAALYLPKKQKDVKSILESKGNKCVTMYFFQSVSKGTLEGGWINGIVKNVSDEEFVSLENTITKFNALFTDVDKKHMIKINFLEDGKTEVFIDESLRGSVFGASFQKALLAVWLGEKPADGDLKKAMLGG